MVANELSGNNSGQGIETQLMAAAPGMPAAVVTVEAPAPAPAAAPSPPSTTPPALDDLLQGDKTGALVMTARREVRRGEREKARKVLQQVFAIDPSDSGALELLGDIFMEEGEQEKALKIYERGRQYHPRHRAFEEKIAVCHIDLAEMERDRIVRQEVLEKGDTDKMLDRKPGLACSLSVFVPGAGQFYNDEGARGGILFGTAIATFCGWYLPLSAAIPKVPKGSKRGSDAIMDSLSAGFHALQGFPQILFWVMLTAWVGTYIFAAFDGYAGAERVNAQRRRALGL